MTSQPPAAIEWAVAVFVPPLAREHVLGDLAERYTSPGQYVLDALRTVPAVVVSQIRRTSFFLLWPAIGIGLTSAFATGAPGWWPRGAVPAVVTLLAFMFRDAYRVPDLKRPRRKGLVDIAVVAAAVLAYQAAIAQWHPELVITRVGLGAGAVALFILYLLRLQNPSGRVPGLA